MAGRRWSDGLHQAVEAKEGVEIRGETQTLATITIQNYFRMYDKLSGMTGTAETEEGEFHQIYGLDVLVIPTNRPIARDDRDDLIFRTKREKYVAIMDEVERLVRLELPVLVGTTNVDVSETLSRMLKRRGIIHQVLNAKHHKSESEIVRDAGQPGAVTVATNMAGRGTDIKLHDSVKEARTLAWVREQGIDLDDVMPVDPVRSEKLKIEDDDDVLEDGGLQIIGSERHDSRRIDRQLRGRSGRQGDPGASQFYLSLEDDLMRLFGSERIANVMDKWGAEEGEVITHGLVTKSIERAQKRVETNNFEARKRLLDYDDVMNQQREVIYDLRLFALEGGEDLKGEIWEMIEQAAQDAIDEYAAVGENPEHWDLAGLRRRMILDFFLVVTELPEENDSEHEHERHEIEAWVLNGLRNSVPPQDRHARRALRADHELHHALRDRREVEGSPLRPGSPQGVDRLPWVGTEGPAGRVQERGLRDVRGPHGRSSEDVSSYFFRAQFGQPQQQRRAPQKLRYSGPTEPSAHGLAGAAGQRASQRAAKGSAIDELGMSARSSAGARTPVDPDPRARSTNVGGAAPARAPISVEGGAGSKRPLSVRVGQKIQEVSRSRLKPGCALA